MDTNTPSLWLERFPWPGADQHKYDRGSALTIGGPPECTGAARLAAQAALRMCGVSTILCSTDAFPFYAVNLLAVMVRAFSNRVIFSDIVDEPRYRAVLIGPGNGVGEATRSRVQRVLSSGKPTVLDADALSAFEGRSRTLFDAINAPTIMTPHMGEFSRLFSDCLSIDQLRRLTREDTSDEARADIVLEAAAQSCAIIVLKGPHTVIAAPDGRTVLNVNAPPSLATAGSGDVLAGIVLGLLASGVEVFDAACMAVWLHGEAASQLGVGMTAEDLDGALPAVLKALHKKSS